jgi:hypothetical protein
MQTKLTLRLDDNLIKAAKRTARSRGKSVSQMVAEHFSSFDQASGSEEGFDAKSLSPATRSMIGILRGVKPRGDERYARLMSKHSRHVDEAAR